MTNFYCSREQVKAAAQLGDTTFDAMVDRIIEGVSRAIDDATHTWFIPKVQTRNYEFNARNVRGGRLWLDADLQSITTITDRGSGRSLTQNTHFLVQPENDGPPYFWLDILRSQGVSWEADPTTTQRSIRIAGSWGAYSSTTAASQLGAAIGTSSATTMQLVDGSKLEVGNTALIGTEQIFVSGRDEIDLGVNTSAALTADDTDTALSLGDPADNLSAGEKIRINSERMLVVSVSSATSVVVERAIDGTQLEAHANGDDIYVFRRFTIERGINGTTAATHADDAAITRYVAPPGIEALAVAESVAAFQQERAGWGRTVGTGERQTELSGRALVDLRRRYLAGNRRHLMVSL